MLGKATERAAISLAPQPLVHKRLTSCQHHCILVSTTAGEMGAVDGRSSALDFAVDACNRVAAALGISSAAVSSAAA